MQTRYAVNLDLAGRVALVTGGSRGIGRATCLALAAHGAKVAVHYCTQAAKAAEVVEEIRGQGGEAIALQADLRDPASAPTLAAAVAASLGPVDILVNNAGEMAGGSVEELTDRTWEDSLSLNLTAAFRLTRACIPMMRSRKWGRIIGLSTQAVYTGSKKLLCLCGGQGGPARADVFSRQGSRRGRDHGQPGCAGPNCHRSDLEKLGGPDGRMDGADAGAPARAARRSGLRDCVPGFRGGIIYHWRNHARERRPGDGLTMEDQ